MGLMFFMYSLVFSEGECSLLGVQDELAMGEMENVELTILWHGKLLGEGAKGCNHGINRILDGVGKLDVIARTRVIRKVIVGRVTTLLKLDELVLKAVVKSIGIGLHYIPRTLVAPLGHLPHASEVTGSLISTTGEDNGQ